MVKKQPFNEAHRIARQKYGTTARADYWLDLLDTTSLDEMMIQLIAQSEYFFLATSSADGRPNVNYKGGEKGFLHVIDENTVIFPDYKGNGILHSIGDIESNPYVGLLIADFRQDVRIKISGKATVLADTSDLQPYQNIFSACHFDRLVLIKIDYVIPNCSNNLSKIRTSILDSNLW